jgi:hypothetical protein
MVTISSYEKRQGTDAKEFFLLMLQGDIEVVFSQTTGMPYATVRKASLPTTFDELTCKNLVGRQLPGNIVKMLVDDYEYVIPGTKEKIVLGYTYVYAPEESKSMEATVFEHAEAA